MSHNSFVLSCLLCCSAIFKSVIQFACVLSVKPSKDLPVDIALFHDGLLAMHGNGPYEQARG